MGRAGRLKGVCTTAALAVAALWPLAARADARDAFIRSLDRPVATRTVKSKSDADPVGQVVCTYYADLMVRETGADTPEPDDATLIPLPAGRARPPCSAARAPGQIALKTQGYGLDGRKGGFLLWDAADPNGAEPFLVMDARSGRILFQDAVSPTDGLRRTAVRQHGVLRLAYTRGYNADCSIVANAKACWSKLVAAGAVPKTMQPLTRPPNACVAAYKGVEANDPSVVTYTIELTLDAAGRTTVLSHGPAGCLPTP